MAEFQPNTLYYGDNLEVLPDFPSECVDLVYLDPPFNSNRSYNVIFRETAGAEAEAQIEAFEDTWAWTTATAEVFDQVASRGDDVGRLLQAFVGALGHNDMTAYLTMMAPRLIELRRVDEADRLDLPSLRPDGEPLLEDGADGFGCVIRGGELTVNEIPVNWREACSTTSPRMHARHPALAPAPSPASALISRHSSWILRWFAELAAWLWHAATACPDLIRSVEMWVASGRESALHLAQVPTRSLTTSPDI